MIRKAIQLAGKTLVVSLPSKWAQAHSVHKGADIAVEERGNKLVLSTERGRQDISREVDLTGTDVMAKRVLGAVFKAGYDDVLVRFSSPTELAAAQEVIREEFIGFEIVERRKDTLHVRSITTLDTKEFGTMLRRLFLAVLGMADESLQAAQKKDTLWLQAVALTDKDVNKYADFCRRLLNKHSFGIAERPMATYYVVEQLERIGDHYRDICMAVQNGASPGSTKLHRDVAALLRNLYDCYYRFSLSQLAAFGKQRQQLTERIATTMAKASGSDLPVLVLFAKLIEDIFDINGAMLVEKL